MSLYTKLQSDRAENSIMQTITIAVSAILIAAGLVTAPGLINNARDNNARTDLANIAYAQEFVLSVGGAYYEYITPEQEEAATGAPSTGNNLMDAAQSAGLTGAATSIGESIEGAGVKFTLSGGVTNHTAVICEASSYYLLKAKSSSGKWFYKGTASGNVTSNFEELLIQIPDVVLAACPDIAVGFPETGATTSGAAELDVDINAFNDGEMFQISGYSPSSAAEVATFGGGDFWSPESNVNSALTLSYFEGGTYHEFYTNSNYLGVALDEINVMYDVPSETLYGVMYIESVVGLEAEFIKFAENGGKASFVSVETAATVEIAWAPATGSVYTDWNPSFPPVDNGTVGSAQTTVNTAGGSASYRFSLPTSLIDISNKSVNDQVLVGTDSNGNPEYQNVWRGTVGAATMTINGITVTGHVTDAGDPALSNDTGMEIVTWGENGDVLLAYFGNGNNSNTFSISGLTFDYIAAGISQEDFDASSPLFSVVVDGQTIRFTTGTGWAV